MMDRIWTKAGVSLRGLQPQTVWAMERAREVFRNRGLNFVLTSAWRASGEKRSLHPEGLAFDCDTDHELSPSVWNLIEDEVRTILGEDYDVIAHASPNWHLHVEWDPDWRKAEEVTVA